MDQAQDLQCRLLGRSCEIHRPVEAHYSHGHSQLGNDPVCEDGLVDSICNQVVLHVRDPLVCVDVDDADVTVGAGVRVQDLLPTSNVGNGKVVGPRKHRRGRELQDTRRQFDDGSTVHRPGKENDILDVLLLDEG